MTIGLGSYNTNYYNLGSSQNQYSSESLPSIDTSMNGSSTQSYNQAFYDVLDSIPGASYDNAYGVAKDTGSTNYQTTNNYSSYPTYDNTNNQNYQSNINFNTNTGQTNTASLNPMQMMMQMFGMVFQMFGMMMQLMQGFMGQK